MRSKCGNYASKRCSFPLLPLFAFLTPSYVPRTLSVKAMISNWDFTVHNWMLTSATSMRTSAGSTVSLTSVVVALADSHPEKIPVSFSHIFSDISLFYWPYMWLMRFYAVVVSCAVFLNVSMCPPYWVDFDGADVERVLSGLYIVGFRLGCGEFTIDICG